MAASQFWQRLLKAFRYSAPDVCSQQWRRHLPLRLETLEDRAVPSTFYVSNGGQDVAGGGGQSNPFGSIQFAINQANSGDTIKVAAGTYTYNAAADQLQSVIGTTAVAVIIGKELTLLGGFTAGNWSTANPSVNQTIIDGQNNFRGVMVLGANAPTSIDFEGFTVQNGFARGIPARGGNGAIFGFGGGMFIDMGAQVGGPLTQVLQNDIFQNNRAIGETTSTTYGGTAAGGGLEDTAGVLTLNNVSFLGNTVQAGNGVDRGGQAVGAGLHAANGATVTGTNLTFSNNVATGGNSSGSGTDSSVNERADALAGAAAIQINSSMTLTNVAATGNKAVGGNAGTGTGANAGGGYGGAFFAENANLTLNNATITNNSVVGGTAANGGIVGGGGVETLNANVTINQATISQNSAAGGASNANGNAGPAGGGGIYLTDFQTGTSTFSIANAIITDNSVSFAGAGNQGIGGGGGGVWIQGDSGTITQSTIANNQIAPSMIFGQGILLISDSTPKPSTLNLSYSIVANELNGSGAAAVHVRPGNTVNLNRNLFANNSLNDNSGGKPVAGGTFNGLSSDITATSAGFISAGSPNFNYGLVASSPARNAGSGSTLTVDRNGNARNSPSDLGALQYVPPTVQFAGVNFEFSETAGQATVTVSMNVTTDTDVSFTFATSDDTAVAGVNYRPVSGTFTIPRGQTSVSISVPLINDSARTGNLRVKLALSGLVGDAVFGPQTTAVITIDDAQASDNAAFVNSLYLNILGRQGDAGGINFYTAQLNNAMNPVLPTVMNYFVTAPEYQGILVNAAGTGFFERYLGRTASTQEASFWVSQLRNGETDEQVIAGFVGSQEYFQNPSKGNSDNATFVQSAFQDILGRAADTGGLNFYLGQLNNGSATRQQVAAALLSSTEYRSDLIQADFQKYLNRPAATNDLNFWLGQIQAGATDEQLITRIGGSLEGYATNGNGNQVWISTLYNKVLGRNPEAAGLSFFDNVLIGGYQQQRFNTALSMATSTEYRTNYIKASFTKYLGRTAGTNDINVWLAQFANGMTDQQFISGLVGSNEYFNNPKKGNGSELTWLQSAFKDLLNQSLDANSQNFFMSEFSNGISLQSAALQITTSPAFQSNTIQNLFQQYLNRSAASGDVNYWLAQFQAGMTTEQVLSQISASQEYFLEAHPGA